LLKELERATPADAGSQGGRGNTKSVSAERTSFEKSPYAKALDEAGLSRQRANRMEALANVPERRLGEMLREQKETVGMNTGQLLRGSSLEPREEMPTLAESGIDKKLSMRAQALAAMPEEHFETP
jgi:hypothetical protein